MGSCGIYFSENHRQNKQKRLSEIYFSKEKQQIIFTYKHVYLHQDKRR